jgi:TRAP-type C4-dicarboxylate transport system permease small subunit
VRVDLLGRHVSPRTRLLLFVVTSFVGVLVMAIFAWQGAKLTWEVYVQGQAALRPWLVPRWVQLIPIPLGSLLLVVEFLRQTWLGVTLLQRGAIPDDPLAPQEELF